MQRIAKLYNVLSLNIIYDVETLTKRLKMAPVVAPQIQLLTAVVKIFDFLNVISTHLMTESNGWFRVSSGIYLSKKEPYITGVTYCPFMYSFYCKHRCN